MRFSTCPSLLAAFGDLRSTPLPCESKDFGDRASCAGLGEGSSAQFAVSGQRAGQKWCPSAIPSFHLAFRQGSGQT